MFFALFIIGQLIQQNSGKMIAANAAGLQQGFFQSLIRIHASNEYVDQLNQLTESDEQRPATHIPTVSKLVKDINPTNHITPEDTFEILWQADEPHLYVIFVNYICCLFFCSLFSELETCLKQRGFIKHNYKLYEC